MLKDVLIMENIIQISQIIITSSFISTLIDVKHVFPSAVEPGLSPGLDTCFHHSKRCFHLEDSFASVGVLT